MLVQVPKRAEPLATRSGGQTWLAGLKMSMTSRCFWFQMNGCDKPQATEDEEQLGRVMVGLGPRKVNLRGWDRL